MADAISTSDSGQSPATQGPENPRTVHRFDEIEARRIVLRDGAGRARIVLEMPDHEDGILPPSYESGGIGAGGDDGYSTMRFMNANGETVGLMGVGFQGEFSLVLTSANRGFDTHVDAENSWRLMPNDEQHDFVTELDPSTAPRPPAEPPSGN